MEFALAASGGFSPLDEELGLIPGVCVTPYLHEAEVRLGTWVASFEQSAKLLHFLTGVKLDAATVRRHTEQAGEVWVEQETAEAQRLEREAPDPPQGPDKQLMSMDGAMVPLLEGKWAEVRTLVIGTIQPPVEEKGEQVVHTRELSYFSRMTPSENFGHLALVETHRRGVETARLVCAPADGADWEQGFIDLHRPDAIRVLDFAHVGERVSEIGQAVFGAADPGAQEWTKGQLHRLKEEGPALLFADLEDLMKANPDLKVLKEHQAYLHKREAHMQYGRYRALGLPIASACVESGNKLVVEVRLKGPGMHWAPEHVDPMLGLRNLVCSDRWEEGWPQIARGLRDRRRHAREARRSRRLEEKMKVLESAASERAPEPPPRNQASPASEGGPVAAACAATAVPVKAPCKPAANHPWRRSGFLHPRPQTLRSPVP